MVRDDRSIYGLNIVILVPVDLTDDLLTKMIDCFKKQKTETSLAAAALFSGTPDAEDVTPEKAAVVASPGAQWVTSPCSSAA